MYGQKWQANPSGSVKIEANPAYSVKNGRQIPLDQSKFTQQTLIDHSWPVFARSRVASAAADCSPRKFRAAAAQVNLDLRYRRVRLKLRNLYDEFLKLCDWAIFMMIFKIM